MPTTLRPLSRAILWASSTSLAAWISNASIAGTGMLFLWYCQANKRIARRFSCCLIKPIKFSFRRRTPFPTAHPLVATIRDHYRHIPRIARSNTSFWLCLVDFSRRSASLSFSKAAINSLVVNFSDFSSIW